MRVATIPRFCLGCQGLTLQAEAYCSACARYHSEYEGKLKAKIRERAADLLVAERTNALFSVQPRVSGLLPASEELARSVLLRGAVMALLLGSSALSSCGGIWALWHYSHVALLALRH